MITPTKKAREKLPLPQLRDLKIGETFYLPRYPDQVYAVSEYDGADFVAHKAWLKGNQEDADRIFDDYIEAFRENQGKDNSPGLYRVVIQLENFETNLIHESVEVVPVHCNVIYQEAANYNI